MYAHRTRNDDQSGAVTLNIYGVDLPCVGLCKPISIGALLSILVDVAEKKMRNCITKCSTPH